MLALLGTAYGLRVLAEDAHCTAETMRRQSVLAEGLGWKVERVQLDDWRRKAGKSLLKKAEANPRPDDFYATKKSIGSRRLADMTLESAFWTRHLYLAIRGTLLAALFVLGVVIAIVVYLALAEPPVATFGVVVAHVVATVVLVAIGVDVVGWLVRLMRQTDSLKDLERSFDRLLDQKVIETPDVLRLVSEYDCVLAGSTPILPMIFRLRHDEIQELWDHRVRDLTDSESEDSPAE